MSADESVRIMIVDDDALVRDTLAMRLEREVDFEIVDAVADAPAALTCARERLPDVVLLDIDLDGVESLHATQALGQAAPEARIVFVSALKHDRLIDFALANGIHGYVTKGEPVEVLIEAIRIVAAGDHFLSQAVSERLTPPPLDAESELPVTRMSLLTDRQREILALIARGHSKKQIANRLQVSLKTVETHSYRLMRRLGCTNRVELTRQAIREGLVTP